MKLALVTATAVAALTLGAGAAAASEPAGASSTQVQTAAAADVREGRAQVDGGEIRYFVHGDLASGRTPLLVLHGAFMTSDGMRPLTDLMGDRPLIVVDQRGHGRTGDLPGPISSERLADDAAAVLADAGVERADVFGYSMGAGAGLQLALRHPDRVFHLVLASTSFNAAGMLPGFSDQMAGITAEVFAGTPMETEFRRLAPDPDAFASVVPKIVAMDPDQDWSADAIRALASPTLIIVGDHDIIRPEHAVELYRLRGGAETARAAQPFLMEPPPARLAILPATSHVGVLGEPDLLVRFIVPFLDDATPAPPPGFF